VSVPQNFVPAVKLNAKVGITVPEYPGKAYSGLVEASSRSVDAASGTTRMQVVVDNAAGQLMPGAFANTRIELPENLQLLTIPASALIFDRQGLRVATVAADGKVVLKPVTIARDLGQVVEIGTGIVASDRIVDSPPDGLSNGDPVRVVVANAQSGKG
jgi:multidrug efflux pump subunit AcrA (membrane-fusion protein)